MVHRFVCDHPGCNKVFNRRDYLERHAANHLDVKPFVCHDCNRQFSRKDLYENHLTTRFHAKHARAGGSHDSDSDSDSEDNEINPQFAVRTNGSATDLIQSLDSIPQDEISLAGTERAGLKFTNQAPLQVLATESLYNRIDSSEQDLWEFYKPLKRMGVGAPPTKRRAEDGGIFPQWSAWMSDPTRAPAPRKRLDRAWQDRLEALTSMDGEIELDPRWSGRPDMRYMWFFDDRLGTAKEKYGYDRTYRDIVEMYTHRAEHMELEPRRDPFTISQRTRALLLSLLCDLPPNFSAKSLEDFSELAWEKTPNISYVVHRATYDPDKAHPALLGVLVMLGMAFSDDNQEARQAARAIYPTVALYAFECLDQSEGLMSARFSPPYVGHLQAICLLLRYEAAVLGDDMPRLSLLRFNAGKNVVKKFLWVTLNSLPHLHLVPESRLIHATRRPVWSSVSREGYVFHEGADPELQWREWAAYEMCKRTVFFAVFADSTLSINDAIQPLSDFTIFNLDLHMVCSNSLWMAKSHEEFFEIIGPTMLVNNVPYLGLVKSMLRFPRMVNAITESQAFWSLDRFSLHLIGYGLMNIIGRMSDIFADGKAIKSIVLSDSVPKSPPETPNFFDRNIQARLYRGLDVWCNSFEVSYGNLIQRLFVKNGNIAVKFSDDPDDEGDSVPQYALLAVLYRYASFIMLHDDMTVVLQVTSNIAKWVEGSNGTFDQQALFDTLYMPLYSQWLQTPESQAMVSTCARLFVWMDAATGQVSRRSWSHQFLSALLYVATVVIWLHDLTQAYNVDGEGLENYTAGSVVTANYEFMDDALAYLHGLLGDTSTAGGISSVVLLGACLLHVRPGCQPFVAMLVKLLRAIEPSLTEESIDKVLDGAANEFAQRQLSSTAAGTTRTSIGVAQENIIH